MTRLLAATTALALFTGPAFAVEGDDAETVATPTGAYNETAADTRRDIAEEEPVEFQVDEAGALDVLINGYTDAHPLVGATVMKSGAPIGTITRIHYDEADVLDAAVVEIAAPSASEDGRDVEIAAEHLGLDPDATEWPPLELTLSSEALEATLSFEESWALRYPDTAFPFATDGDDANDDLQRAR